MLAKKEIEAMLKKNSKERYIYSIKRIVDFEALWVLEENDKFAMSGNDKGSSFLAIWPAMEYAKMCATGEWDKYKEKSIGLDYFMHNLLPQLKKDQVSIGVFMVSSETNTPIATAESILCDLNSECAKYEDYDPDF